MVKRIEDKERVTEGERQRRGGRETEGKASKRDRERGQKKGGGYKYEKDKAR